ncbi:MAG: thiosulfate reductase [Planctomycetota bacterium]|nr:thiosulfate reductase [Planctomycetota bacterium]
MPRLENRHSLPTRLCHWLNVPVLGVMAWSGIAISASKAPYTIKIGGRTLLTLFPEIAFRELDMPVLPTAMGWHFTFAWLLFLNGGLYLAWTVGSGGWRTILPRRGTLREAGRVVWNDLGFAKTPPDRTGTYNGAQKIAYSIAIGMGIGLVLTGLAIFRPVQLGWLTRILGGYQMARAEHFWLTMLMFVFVAIHVLQVLRAGWNTLRSMILGFEVVDETEVARDPS